MSKTLKEHKGKLIVSSALLLVPMLVGILLWDRLPNTLAVHWGIQGTADGFGQKALAVFGIAGILLILHWVCILVTAADRQNHGRNRKAIGMVCWIMPVLAWFACGLMYSVALGVELGMNRLLLVLIALLFLVLGNYLPKISQNFTLGIKLPWTLGSTENWNRTHRFGGRVWCVGGLVLLFATLLPNTVFLTVLLLDIAVTAILPAVYSYAFYRRQRAAGECAAAPVIPPLHKKTGMVGTVVGVLAVIGAVVLMFTGNIAVQVEQESFTIAATYYNDLTVRYADIGSIELRETDTPGQRVGGFGSARLLMGLFENEEFGHYTRYSYTGANACVVLKNGDEVLVLAGRTDEQTRQWYRDITAHTGG